LERKKQQKIAVSVKKINKQKYYEIKDPLIFLKNLSLKIEIKI